jgi:thiamine biosynthesis lipoprotein
MATSGDYRNFFDQSGERFAHVLDPRTAMPVRHDLASVTVVARTCMAADALSTALMVMGPEAGCDLARRQRIAALFLLRRGREIHEIASPAFAAGGFV